MSKSELAKRYFVSNRPIQRQQRLTCRSKSPFGQWICPVLWHLIFINNFSENWGGEGKIEIQRDQGAKASLMVAGKMKKMEIYIRDFIFTGTTTRERTHGDGHDGGGRGEWHLIFWGTVEGLAIGPIWRGGGGAVDKSDHCDLDLITNDHFLLFIIFAKVHCLLPFQRRSKGKGNTTQS